MVMNRLLLKNLWREVRRTYVRFLSIFSISLLGAAFFAGIRATGPDMQDTANTYFERTDLADITVMCSQGLSQDDVDALRDIPGVAAVRPYVTADAMMTAPSSQKEWNIRLISLPIAEGGRGGAGLTLLPSLDLDDEASPVNQLDVVSGRLPLDDHEVALDNGLRDGLGAELGDMVCFAAMGSTLELRVVGFVESSQYLSEIERGNSSVGNGTCDGVAFASGNAVGSVSSKLPLMSLMRVTYTQAAVEISGLDNISAFSQEYDAAVNQMVRRIEEYANTQDGTWYVQTRDSNPGYTDYQENTQRIKAVGDVFPVLFFLVAALVSLTTMTRMVEEQRIEMGTLKALGYGQTTIMGKYMAYAMLASFSGALVGCVIGFRLFPLVIGTAYSIMYRLPDFTTPFRMEIAVWAVLATVACTCGATLWAGWAALRAVPATLMRPKAPKPGKRILLEYIKPLWKRMSFTNKVTARNIFRYKKRFYMSVVGIAGSTALLLTAFGLKDSIFGIMDQQFGVLWQMDAQGYAYDTMAKEQLQGILEGSLGEVRPDDVLYCSYKPYEVDMDGKITNNVYVMGVESPQTLCPVIRLMDNGKEFTLGQQGAVITRKLAESYSLSVGDTLTLQSGGDTYQVTVAGVTDNYVYHYVYLTADYYEQVFGAKMLYNGFLLNIETELTQEQQDAFAQRVLSDGRMYTLSFSSGVYEQVLNSLSILDYVVVLLILSSALLTFVVMLNLTNINITERKRELATLRVLGFVDKEMYDYIFRENNTLSLLGAAVGLLLGKAMHAFVIKTCEVDIVMFVRSVEPLSYVYSIILTVVFSLMVNLMMRPKVRKIDMVESMKSAE